MEQQTLFTYILTCLVAAGTPGPGTLSVIVYGAMIGWKRTLPVIFGIQVGMFAMAILALSGISAVITTSPILFIALQYLGAGYIAWLGISSLLATYRQKQSSNIEASIRDRGGKGNFYHGAIVTFASPKTLLFFTSFFPLFLDSNQPILAQNIWLLFILLLCTLVIHLIYSALMNKMTILFHRYNQQFNVGVGIIFLGLALYMLYGTMLSH
ncbi:threonine/homoserine/homoserine lactone efflux protein [Bibersteinia trehalosi]|uniref:LysE family translocator n=1 Tax=Bibersteinia trehalosi TaxID=47735 RepID=UPI0010540D5C|nr:LysE family translocator [Bibersteinia trehalosi]TCT16649.1 threonine/homoserine/homoserine lactone efflux protein [Bibersteinia trehalosi]